MVEMGAVGRTDSGAYRPSLEIPEWEDLDLLQRLPASMVAGPPAYLAFRVEMLGPGEAGAIRDHSVEDARIVGAIGGTSLTIGPTASTSVPPTMIPSIEVHVEGWIDLPLVECSTRYAVLLIFPRHACQRCLAIW